MDDLEATVVQVMGRPSLRMVRDSPAASVTDPWKSHMGPLRSLPGSRADDARDPIMRASLKRLGSVSR